MPNLDELLRGIAELNPDPAEFSTSLQGAFQPGYHEIFTRGHKVATSDSKKKVADLTKTLAEKDDEIVRLNDRVTDAGKGNENVEKVRADYKKEVEAGNAKAKERETALTAQLSKERTDRVVGDLRRLFAATDKGGFGMFDVHADAFAEKIRPRVRHRDDGSFEILKEAGSDVAIQPADGRPETALAIAAKELAASAPKEMFASKVQGRGAGGKAEDGSGGGGTRFDRIREDAKARQDSKAGTTKGGDLLGRMGVSKPA